MITRYLIPKHTFYPTKQTTQILVILLFIFTETHTTLREKITASIFESNERPESDLKQKIKRR